MEEDILPSLEGQDPPKKKIPFIELVQKSLNKGAKIDPLFFSDVINEVEKKGEKVDLVFDEKMREKIKAEQGDDLLKQWDDLHAGTLEINKLSQGKAFHEPILTGSYYNKGLGYNHFSGSKKSKTSGTGEFGHHFASPVRIRTMEEIADEAPAIIDFDPKEGYFERQINGQQDITDIVSMKGEGKQLTLATNGIVGLVNPEIQNLIKEGVIDKDDIFKDQDGYYRYRTMKKGERATDKIRSVWGPSSSYHSNYFVELAESLNDLLIDSLDGAKYISQLPMHGALNLTQFGARSMGLEANWADSWNDGLNDQRNWSASRKSTSSFEDEIGVFGDFTNLSKGFVNVAGQIMLTRGMGLVGGLGASVTKGAMQYFGKTLSDQAARNMMQGFGMGYNFFYASAMANEEARKAGLGHGEGHLMGVTAGMVMLMTEKLTGGQFTDKVLGPLKSKAYSKKILEDIAGSAKASGLTFQEIVKNKSLFSKIVGNSAGKMSRWLSETAETRMKNVVQGAVGEAFQEATEDGTNMLVQEFRDWITGEDKYHNTFADAINELGTSAFLGGLGGAFGGSVFFNKKHWEMSYVDESKYDYITAAALKGELGNVRSALENEYKKGTLGSTLHSAMMNSKGGTELMINERDPTAVNQNEFLYQQFKAQLELVESIVSKYETLLPKKSDFGDFITNVTGGKAFVEDGPFADIAENTAHMMQREAVAFEIKRNHAVNTAALKIAQSKDPGTGLGQIDAIQAVGGKLLGVRTKGSVGFEMPSITVKNLLEQSLRDVKDAKGSLVGLRAMHAAVEALDIQLEEAEYLLSKNPSDPVLMQNVETLKEGYDKEVEKLKAEIKKEKFDESMVEIMDALSHYDNLENEFKDGKRKDFYSTKALIESVKIKYAPAMDPYKEMTVKHWNDKKRDKAYFETTIETERENNKAKATEFDQIINILETASPKESGQILNNLIALKERHGRIFLSPEAVVKTKEIFERLKQENPALIAALDLPSLEIGQNTVLTEELLKTNLRKLLGLSEAIARFEKDSSNMPQEEKQVIADQMGLHTFDMLFGSRGQDKSLDALLSEMGSNEDAVQKKAAEMIEAIGKLEALGLSGKALLATDLRKFLDFLFGDDFQGYLENRQNLKQMEALSLMEATPDVLQMGIIDMSDYLEDGADFSDFEGDDIIMLNRANNRNRNNSDNMGSSIARGVAELFSDYRKAENEFSETARIASLIKEVQENLMELILQHEENQWGTENDGEKFKRLAGVLERMLSSLNVLEMVAGQNLAKRSARDYQTKQDYVNFTVKQLITLNGLLKFMEKEEVDALEELILATDSGIVFSDVMKKQIDEKIKLTIDAEVKASESLRERLKSPDGAAVVMKHMGIELNDLASFNRDNTISQSVFRDLHEDIDTPYDPNSESSRKEQVFNFLTMLERGNIRTFFNRFDEYLDSLTLDDVFIPSFEQALAARQVFSFLSFESDSVFKQELNSHTKNITKDDGTPLKSKVRFDSHMIFVRGIGGAGKSTFVIKLGFQLLAMDNKLNGKSETVLYSAPYEAQVKNIGDTFAEIDSEGASFQEHQLSQIHKMGSKVSKNGFSGSRKIVIDEATLDGAPLDKLMTNIAVYNESAPDGDKIKIIMIGDEFQNASSYTKGKPVFYSLANMNVIERTVPLTTPYRSGKVESFSLQMNSRRIIAEIAKLETAISKGLPYTVPGSKESRKLTWNTAMTAVEEIYQYFNTPKETHYSEISQGVIEFGVRIVKTEDEVYDGFLDRLNHSLPLNEDSEVVFITTVEEKDNIISILAKKATEKGLGFTAASLEKYVFTSASIQGSTKQHVFTTINPANAVKSKKADEAKIMFQSIYVAQSREKSSLTVVIPGDHRSVKVSSSDKVISYPSVKMNDKDASNNPTPQVLEVRKENNNIAVLIKSLRGDDDAPAAVAVVDTKTKAAGTTQSEAEKQTENKRKMKRKTKTEEETNTENELNKENHENEDAWKDLKNDPKKFIKEAMEKYPDMASIFKALEEDNDGACAV